MPASKGRWWLTRDSHQIVIGTSPGRIYGLVSDLPRMGEWSPECERVEWTGTTTVAAEGARFVGRNRGGPFRLMRWSRHGRARYGVRIEHGFSSPQSWAGSDPRAQPGAAILAVGERITTA